MLLKLCTECLLLVVVDTMCLFVMWMINVLMLLSRVYFDVRGRGGKSGTGACAIL